MQQTAVAVVETKDLTIVDVDLETTLVSGSSYFSYAVAEMVLVLTVAVVETTAYGLSSFYSAVADLVVMETVADATTTAATNIIQTKPLSSGRRLLFVFYSILTFVLIYSFDMVF